ncbi:MAG: molybdenum cofactor guanylyltransferase [Thermoproteota archaeon]
MNRSAIILAGGSSNRFGQDKALVKFLDKPLITHVINRVCGMVEEVLIVASSQEQAEKLSKVTSKIPSLVDSYDLHGPLAGALTGFEEARGKYSLLIPCDTPLISKVVIQHLFRACEGRDAAVPRWPNGYIEPLQSIYRTKPALKSAISALKEGRRDIRSMIEGMSQVRYISTNALRRLNPQLSTFLNVNTTQDLKMAESLLNPVNSKIRDT